LEKGSEIWWYEPSVGEVAGMAPDAIKNGYESLKLLVRNGIIYIDSKSLICETG